MPLSRFSGEWVWALTKPGSRSLLRPSMIRPEQSAARGAGALMDTILLPPDQHVLSLCGSTVNGVEHQDVADFDAVGHAAHLAVLGMNRELVCRKTAVATIQPRRGNAHRNT